MNSPQQAPSPRTRPIKTVLLDLGNVLVFHDDDVVRRELGRAANLSGDEVKARLAPLWWPVNKGTLDNAPLRAEVCQRLGINVDAATFDRLWNCHFSVHHAALPLIAELFGRVRVVLLSNTHTLHYRAVEPMLPILSRFDEILLSHELGLAKPEDEIYREALRRSGSAPEETAYWDDVVAYVQASKNLGIAGHVFTTASAFAADLRALGLR